MSKGRAFWTWDDGMKDTFMAISPRTNRNRHEVNLHVTVPQTQCIARAASVRSPFGAGFVLCAFVYAAEAWVGLWCMGLSTVKCYIHLW